MPAAVTALPACQATLRIACDAFTTQIRVVRSVLSVSRCVQQEMLVDKLKLLDYETAFCKKK